MSALAFPCLIALALALAPPDGPDSDKKDAKDDAKPRTPPTLAEKTKGLRKIDGFLPLHWDDRAGKLWMEVARYDREFLVQEALATGLGSNPVGLDRGQLGASSVVVFRRVGPKVLLVGTNQRYRALTDRAVERRAVEESFASTVLAGFAVEAEDPETGRVLVDATPFFVRDAHGVAERLRQSKQGTYKLDASRSALDPARVKGFPKNTEVEALLTFATEGEPGSLVAQTAATPQAFTVRQRHSLVELPALGGDFKPRPADPRVGTLTEVFYDFASPFDVPVEKRWVARHRLVKKDPNAEKSEPVEPIVYYVDPAAPEPLRSALVEGASWWASAFGKAGFPNAFRVEVLPDGADPMDLRYNVIQWVHRSTRGWSYGNAVTDPRTGEILKGRVTLDSLRARQAALIGAGLVNSDGGRNRCAVAAGPGPEDLAALDPQADLGAMVVARVRQLSAHEVGHTLGFAHNFAASTYGRASVMDYPAPLVKIVDGHLDLSDAYSRGVGPYDAFAVTYAYAQFPPGADEAKELRAIVRRGVSDGLLFLSDADARPAGAAHPLASLWDNGDDPVAALKQAMDVRRIALERFGLTALHDGAPLSDLEAKFLPVYLYHRYQLQAAVKSLGGLSYSYAVKDGDAPSPARVAELVPAERQRAALSAVLETLRPENLAIPSRVLDLIPPPAYATEGGTSEVFARATGPAFDALAPVRAAADLAVSALLQPQRAARLEAHHARDAKQPDFGEVVDSLMDQTWGHGLPEGSSRSPVVLTVQRRVVAGLIDLAGQGDAAPHVRDVAEEALRTLGEGLRANRYGPSDAHNRTVRAEIERFLGRPDLTHRPTPPTPAPPGDPIGAAGR